MALKVGDKCPVCKEGLLERSELGITCSQCSFDMEIGEVVREVERSKKQVGAQTGYVFKAKTFKIVVDDPEEAEEFLRGLILAKQNNNSEYFPTLIDAVNAVLEPWRGAQLAQQMADRSAAGMS